MENTITLTARLHPAMAAWKKLPIGIRAEVLNEQLYILGSPTTYHGEAITKISFGLINYVYHRNLGSVFNGPVDVFLKEKSNVVVPDITFVSNDNPHASIERKGIFGPPDLIVEVLSPNARKHDTIVKKQLYEASGVGEYWIVDPESKNAHGYFLKHGKYDDAVMLKSKIVIRIFNITINF